MSILARIAATQLPNTLDDAPVMTKENYARQARGASTPLRFATSSSGVPAPYARLEHMGCLTADAFRLAGMTADDAQLNLAAPAPHPSGWMAQKGANAIGATPLNHDFTDWERPIREGTGAEATVLSSIPAKALDLADEVASAHGQPREIFPNLEVGFLTGHLLRPGTRRELRDRWGLETTREFYGSSEAGMVAGAIDESRRMVPLLHRLILEIEVNGEIIDIRDVDRPTEGSLLISDPARTSIDLTRYRQGDRVRVYPDDPLPRLKPLGREDDAVDFAGALVHPSDLFEAVDETIPTASNALAVVYDNEQQVSLEVYVEGLDDVDTIAFYETLCDRQPALRHAIGERPAERITAIAVEDLGSLSFVNDDGLKGRRIVFMSDRDE